ncbi:MAG: FAD/NAD(P)-binding protein [Chloroflexi bacterium]|nr:FAD/NAD(P)-binding protein [Chloroflexota bacterium]
MTPDIKLFDLEIEDEAVRRRFAYKPGQFVFVSAFGVGEAPFGIASVYSRQPGIEVAVRRVGTVTSALHEMEAGARVGIRGPYGNFFPLDEYKGKDMYIIGGGVGMAPLRPVVNSILGRRQEFGKLVVLYGARSPQDLAFADEFDYWAEAPNTRLELTVDRGDEGWKGRVALIPAVVKELAFSASNSVALICGPPIMIRFTLVELKKLSFADHQIVTTLEAKMKCGMGKCARCNVGDKYVCRQGPVFTLEQIGDFIEAY